MRRLVLLRHGRTEWNDTGRAQGHADVPLDEVGEAQAKAVAPVLAALRPVAVWSSDLARAAATAAVVAAEAGLEPVLDPRLREYDVGRNRVGLTDEQYAGAHPDEHAALLAGDIAAIPGRETRADVVARLLPALTSYADGLGEGETGIVVSHGAALRTAVPAFLGWGDDAGDGLGVLANCGWVELTHSASAWTGGAVRWRLTAWNRVVA
ncbi:histidine phosphatase family protein [Nocardioides sp. zg-1228]|uniref:histidine phosphatase family protein n=1 Tax=Nocardioides sp. zg-1228 TaxID=2763008 RepID=UPI00164259D8|nr:histidine phosphatase family protein [Nocardioides sp. zg-1228]MBC2934135.1 histidine phosphatase family protein [Nocardioides sp. zg-1228]QSF58882.1 histidine phosphatase family protein [Nocardioides sp. zg-1228]